MTNPRDALHYNERAANKYGGRSVDKLATELSSQRFASKLRKLPIFSYRAYGAR